MSVPASYGLGVVILDFDADGREDVLVGNDSMRNFLFRNEGGFSFTEIGIKSGIAANGDGSNQATMGIAIADVNSDSRPDVFSTNFASDTNTLHLNQLAARDQASANVGFFDDGTRRHGLGMTSYSSLGWACSFIDFDHDGDEDLLIVNGHVYPNATVEAMDAELLEPPLLYERLGARFHLVAASESTSRT